jgi:hypothetical protein
LSQAARAGGGWAGAQTRRWSIAEANLLLLTRTISLTTRTLGRPELESSAPSLRRTLPLIVAAGAIYGGVMGSFELDSPERALLMVFGAAKVPLLIFVTTLICLPAYFMLNTVLGLRAEFAAATRAVIAAQAALTLALASLAPFTRFAYFSGLDHRQAILFNAAMFTLATAAGQVVLLRRYRPLIARNPRHRITLWSWVVMYAFVGIQSGWMLRPFVGTPGRPVTFLRDEPFSNAYVVIARLVVGVF